MDYNNTVERPAGGVVVEALSGTGTVLATTTADASGNYSVSVDSNTDVRIRAKAQLLQTTTPSWDVRVTDNTSGNALYAIDGTLTSSGTVNSIRDLNADSGWGGTSYTGARAAAPFAILAPVYNAIQDFAAVDTTVVFPPMEMRWSVNNRAVAGNLADGDISTSFYQGGNVYLLGDENSDTDEYDKHVVTHEWGHYFEDNLSRSDSIGGPHGSADRLDPRVALGEGFGNALAAMVLDDPIYRDSLNAQQAQGFSINVESNSHTNEGWFNEGTVQSILYDLYDTDSDGADTFSLGLAPIYNTLISTDYTSTPVFLSIFAFLTEFKVQAAGNDAAIDSFVAGQSVNGTGIEGTGETATGGITNALPLFKTTTVNGTALQVCSIDDAGGTSGDSNKLGAREFVKFNVSAAGNHTFTMSRISGPTGRDPDFYIYRAGGVFVDSGILTTVDTETKTVNLTAGDYLLDVTDDKNRVGPFGDACFNLTITR